ncbi:Delta-latroinsectotoxin [Dactylella cylindrospora]|nr:Delta-latroinsectotoxin [Dactylella cylindrospora]
MAEVAGVAASVIAMVTVTTQIIALTSKFYISATERKGRILELANAVQSISSILKDIHKLAEQDAGKSSSSFKALQSDKGPLNDCYALLKKIERTLEEASSGRASVLKWPIKEKELDSALERLEQYKTILITTLSLESMRILGSIDDRLDSMDAKMDDLLVEAKAQAEWRNDEKYTRILEWIEPSPPSCRHETVSLSRQTGTGGWFFKDMTFIRWCNGTSRSKVLWCRGIPGCGKSTMISAVVKKLETLQRQRGKSEIAIAYFYFDFSDKAMDVRKFSRSIVKQLAFQSGKFPDEVKMLYDEYSRSGKEASNQEVNELLLKLAGASDTAYILVDALDECNDDYRGAIGEILQELASVGVRLFVTSRTHPEDVNEWFDQADKIELRAHPDDISVYLQAEMDRNVRGRRLNPKLRERITSDLVSMSQGMFLLPKFQLNYLLKQATPRKMEMALDRITEHSDEFRPLDATFKLMLDGVRDWDKDTVQNALLWLTVARAPLRIQDLMIALSIEVGTNAIEEDQILAKNTLLDICAGFIVIDGSGIARLAHQTIRTFILENMQGSTDALLTLTQICLTYLSFDRFREQLFIDGLGGERNRRLRNMLRIPFYLYSMKHWEDQASLCNPKDISEDLIRFLENKDALRSYCKARRSTTTYPRSDPLYHLYEPGGDDTPLHVAARVGNEIAVQYFISKGIPVDIQNDQWYPPLNEAATWGRTNIVQLLLDAGASPTRNDRILVFPIHVAAALNYAEIVRILVEADPKTASEARVWGWTPLHEAALRGNRESVEILLEAGADWRLQNGQGRRVNSAVLIIEGGHGNLIPALMKYGFSLKGPLSSSNFNGGGPLHVAAFQGNEDLVRHILELGGKELVLELDAFENTPLHNAVIANSLPIVRLLVESGANVERENIKGQIALDIAVQQKCAPIITYLKSLPRKTDVSHDEMKNSNGDLTRERRDRTPSLHDIKKVYFLLHKVLRIPATSTKRILDYAQYWAQQTHKESKFMTVNECKVPVPYLRIPVSGAAVRKIVFRTITQDRGLSRYYNLHDPYRGGFSWIEARVELRDELKVSDAKTKSATQKRHGLLLEARKIHDNMHPCGESRENTKTWDITTTRESNLRNWLSALEYGDRILVCPATKHLGWESTIEEAEVSIFTTLWPYE